MRPRAAVLGVVLALLAGCGTGSTDYPLAAGQANPPSPRIDANPDHPFVVLTFSGGGSRAAALAAAVVERLNHIEYTAGGETRTLASDIAVVSSVSGGSVYAADLGLNGPTHAAAFLQRIGGYDGIGWLVRRALNPFTWLTLAAENTTRIELQQEMLEDLLQTHATFAGLNGPGKPLILMNATDMVAGAVFTFNRDTLDDLCMDYGRIPVSLAVNASAAVPIAYTPVLLRNDSYLDTGCPGQRSAHLPYRTTLQAAGGPYANLEAFRDARYRQSLRNERIPPQASADAVPPYRTPHYLRLVDGGVADNSGLTALRGALLTTGAASAPADVGVLAGQGRLRRLVVIAVNARSDPPSGLDTSPEYTNVLDIANGISGSLVNSASANSAAVFDGFIKQLVADRDTLVRAGVAQANFAVYPVTIDFDQLPDATPDERQQQQRVKSIATSWTLKSGDADQLSQVAGKLLWRHPCFRLLVHDAGLNGTPEAAPVDVACPYAPPHPPS